jgi:RNA polymerase sigma-70 factor, ECF subfamily
VSEPDPLRPLLDAAVEGDDAALAELVRRTQPLIWRLCSLLGSPGAEEDLAQEVYVRALPALNRYRGESTVQSWLLGIARRVCADHVRQRQRQRRLLGRLADTATTSSPPPTSAPHELIAELEPDKRTAFALTQLLGLSYEEAAEVMDCPVGTIRSRVARARADLLALVEHVEAL